jgi:hypothetical protein
VAIASTTAIGPATINSTFSLIIIITDRPLELRCFINNTVGFRAQDELMLRSQTLNLYLTFHSKTAYLHHLVDCG